MSSEVNAYLQLLPSMARCEVTYKLYISIGSFIIKSQPTIKPGYIFTHAYWGAGLDLDTDLPTMICHHSCTFCSFIAVWWQFKMLSLISLLFSWSPLILIWTAKRHQKPEGRQILAKVTRRYGDKIFVFNIVYPCPLQPVLLSQWILCWPSLHSGNGWCIHNCFRNSPANTRVKVTAPFTQWPSSESTAP